MFISGPLTAAKMLQATAFTVLYVIASLTAQTIRPLLVRQSTQTLVQAQHWTNEHGHDYLALTFTWQHPGDELLSFDDVIEVTATQVGISLAADYTRMEVLAPETFERVNWRKAQTATFLFILASPDKPVTVTYGPRTEAVFNLHERITLYRSGDVWLPGL